MGGLKANSQLSFERAIVGQKCRLRHPIKEFYTVNLERNST